MPMLMVDWAKCCLLISSWGAGHFDLLHTPDDVEGIQDHPISGSRKGENGPRVAYTRPCYLKRFSFLQNAPPSRNFAWHTLASIELVPNFHL